MQIKFQQILRFDPTTIVTYNYSFLGLAQIKTIF